MFTWHEATRRRFCRLAFCALVMVPTCAVLLTAAWLRTPQHLEGYRRQLAEQLALDVTLTNVRFPRPRATFYEGLTLVDPETHTTLAALRTLELDQSGGKTLLTCAGAELNGTRLDLFWELAARRMRRQSNLGRPLEIVAPELALHLAGKPLRVRQVRGRFEQGKTGPPGLIAFQLGDRESSDSSPDASGNEAAVRLMLFRNRQPSGATAVALQLESGKTVIPADLMVALVPNWDRLGSVATFAGSLWWQERNDGWAGEACGWLRDVDLDRLVSAPFGRKLEGKASLGLDFVRIEHGRLVAARGRLEAGPGLVNRALLADVALHLGLQTNVPSEAPGAHTAYEQLGAVFVLDQQGLTIRGDVPSAQAGTLLVGRTGRPLLKEPAVSAQSPLNLVRALAGAGQQRLPVSAAAQALMRLLPESTESAARQPAAMRGEPRTARAAVTE